MSASHIRFRSDIQGLRALAVVPIVLFHAGIKVLPGGYLGVDIFFVISGFLITRIIVQELEGGNFTFFSFYKRRAVRIFPALIVMLAVTMAVSTQVLFKPLLVPNAKAGAAAATFVANIYFWRTTNYFAPASEIQIYLHTWSLGVEEQFYIFYPIFLVLLYRYARRWMGAGIVATILLSFAVSWALYLRGPGLAFFLLPARAWQLGLGAAVALDLFPPLNSRRARVTAAFAGLIFIVASLIIIDETWQIPAPWALPASLGTALLIAYGEGAPTSWLLSLKPLVWIGTISYSLYLWHWPIMALYLLDIGVASTPVQISAILLACVLFGAASCYLVERPGMRLLQPYPARPIVGGAIVILVVVAIAFLGIARKPDGWASFSPEARRVASYIDYPESAQAYAQYRQGVCFAPLGKMLFDEATCLRQQPGKPTIALVGDSHAAQYYQVLRSRLSNYNLIQITGAGCDLLLNGKGTAECGTLSHILYDKVIPHQTLSRVILAERWRRDQMVELQRTILFFKKKNIPVSVIGPVEEFDQPMPLLLARAVEAHNLSGIEKDRTAEPIKLDAFMAKNVPAMGAGYYSVQQIECGHGQCQYFADGVPIHSDYGHVTQNGAAFLLQKFHVK